MEEHIAQSTEGNCCMKPREHPFLDMDFGVCSKSEVEVKTHENVMVSSCANEMVDDEVRRSRKRRHRRGKSVHKHRFSKHRRDLLARALRGGNNHRVLGAPRNDNDFLMSQYIEGLHVVDETHNPTSNGHHRLADPTKLDPACFFPEDDDIPRHHFSPSSSPGSGSYSPTTSGSIYSDYSSLPSSPDDLNHGGLNHYDNPHPTSQPHEEDAAARVDSYNRGIVMDGTDADFLQRNFEEEYNNNITRGLQEATKEELISKCMKLTEKLKQLEQRKVLRLIPSDVSREPRFSC
ncbi:uncharacterized protein [Asterias amurensis]|uniref:uncharacterized protein n=1 Tax=Asterias amurensis TaxID=7602 RepID=UPI003AB4AD29